MNGHSKYHVPQSVYNGSSKCGNHAACDVDNQRDGSTIDICSQRKHTENVSKTPTRSQPSNGVWTRCKNQTRNHIYEHSTLLLREVICYTWNNAVQTRIIYRCFTQTPCVHPLLSRPRTRPPLMDMSRDLFWKVPKQPSMTSLPGRTTPQDRVSLMTLNTRYTPSPHTPVSIQIFVMCYL